MDIFIRNIAYAANDMDVQVAMAQILHRHPFPLHPPINFHVELFRQKRNGNHKGIGILTLPMKPLGEMLLRLYGSSGLSVKSRIILFSPSTRPLNRGVVERLLSSTWEDPLVVQKEKERKAQASEPIALAEFSYGRFCRDGSFSAEDGLSGTGRIACDINERRMKLTVDDFGQNIQPNLSLENLLDNMFQAMELSFSTASAVYSPNQVKTLIASGVSSALTDIPRIFLESLTPPIFEEKNTLTTELDLYFHPKDDKRRCSSLKYGYDMPPGCTTLCLTFRTRDDLEVCRERCRELHLPVMQEREIDFQTRSVYSKDNMAQLDNFLGSLEFGLAFQIEKAVMESILEPLEVISLEDDIQTLQDEYGLQAYALFKYFAETLRGSFRDLPSRRQRSGRRAPIAAQTQAGVPDLSSQLAEAIIAYSMKQNQVQPLSFTSPAFFLSYHLIVTPSARILEGPLPDQSNSVLRRFQNHDCFLRVSFHDENRSKLRRDPELDISNLLKSRFRGLLISGFRLAGRGYEFLGYSMSGLREHSVWFVTPFEWEGIHMDAGSIRNMLGDFSRLSHEPARLAARWSQAFSATDPTIVLEIAEIQEIEDRVSGNDSCFTDGCGTISYELAEVVWSTIRSQKGYISGRKHVPSCFQIRLGGAKGVVVLDPTLPGRLIRLRPSQKKFEAPNVRTLDIQSTSSRPRLMFLNRPMIVILEHLGVKKEAFTFLQDMVINDIQSSRTSFMEASKLMGQNGLGASFRLPSLMSNLKTQLGLDIGRDSESRYLHHNLIQESIRCACVHTLREVKYRAHIRVPGSFTLLGVSDEWRCLREGEIYATIFDERTRVTRPIEGRVLISRSPQVHPGDMQYVTAVRRPELSHLRNVVVFSCTGQRSLPSCLSGGDLDGDDYNLILDPTLHPPIISPPGEYKGVPNLRTLYPCTIADVADFVINFIGSDLLGYISILHLRFADLKGPDCNECMDLAELASHAVDYPKTGAPINFAKLPRPPQIEKPDFLMSEAWNNRSSDGFYRSEKMLGTLFRRVLIDDYSSAPYHGDLAPSDGAIIQTCLTSNMPVGLSPLEPAPEDLKAEMKFFLEVYTDQLLVIAQTHTLSKHPESRLSEEELVSGTIMAKWADRHKRREAINAMNLQTQQLTKAVRSEFVREADPESADYDEWDSDDSEYDEDLDRRVQIETLKRAWAAWNVAEEALKEDPEVFGPSSFGIIAMGTMLEIIKKVRTKYDPNIDEDCADNFWYA